MAKNKVEHVVIAHFKYLDDTIAAIKKIKSASIKDFDIYSAFPNHDLEDAIYEDSWPSPIRLFVLIGTVTGCLGAFLMTSWMSIDYPLRTSAKELMSFPAFVVIGFECTILLGALSNITSMFHFSRIPNLFKPKSFRPNFTGDTFGVAVRVSKDEVGEWENSLKELGAHEVENQYVR